jgi:hypothetical protein
MNNRTELQIAQGEYSDLYKDVHGFRPRYSIDVEWNSIEWLDIQCSNLYVELQEVMASEEIIEKESIVKFEAQVNEIINTGAGNRETALRWLLDAEEDEYAKNDKDFYCFKNGLPYGYFNEIKKEIIC